MATDANRDPSTGRVMMENLAHPVTIRREISNREIREMLDWCKNEELPGEFRHRFDHTNGMIVSFTNKDVAFEFKMIWG